MFLCVREWADAGLKARSVIAASRSRSLGILSGKHWFSRSGPDTCGTQTADFHVEAVVRSFVALLRRRRVDRGRYDCLAEAGDTQRGPLGMSSDSIDNAL